MSHPLSSFDRVAIINLPERADRRRETTAEIERIGGFDGGRIEFVDAYRPADPGPFPSIGARGCFMSQLSVLQQARADQVDRLLILEDDVQFVPDFAARMAALAPVIASGDCNIFYGAYTEPQRGNARGWAPIGAEQPLTTASFIGFDRTTVARLVPFVEAMLERPAGSPDYGPMHVDGAYTVFRKLHPDVITIAAVPPVSGQRSSRSNITESGMLLDRVPALRGVGNALRRLRDRVR